MPSTPNVERGLFSRCPKGQGREANLSGADVTRRDGNPRRDFCGAHGDGAGAEPGWKKTLYVCKSVRQQRSVIDLAGAEKRSRGISGPAEPVAAEFDPGRAIPAEWPSLHNSGLITDFAAAVVSVIDSTSARGQGNSPLPNRRGSPRTSASRRTANTPS